jgi:hypothetical protein
MPQHDESNASAGSFLTEMNWKRGLGNWPARVERSVAIKGALSRINGTNDLLKRVSENVRAICDKSIALVATLSILRF